MAFTTSPNMNLTIPGVGTENSPQWATDINASLAAIDSHNHSSGQGVPINPSGMNISSNLAFQGNQAAGVGAVVFNSISSLATLNALYVIGGELWYNDTSNPVQITLNGSVAGSPGSISGLTSPASASYSAGSFSWQSTATSGANMVMESVVLTNSGSLTNQLTLQAPSLSGSITETLPTVPSGDPAFMTMDTSGNMGTSVSTVGGITRPNLAAVGQKVTFSCGSFSTTSTTAVAVTNLSNSITTSGRPVMLMIQPSGAGFFETSAGEILQIYLFRGATLLSSYSIGSPGAVAIEFPASITYLDQPSASTYTYSIMAASQLGGNVQIVNCVMVLYEL